MSDLSKNPPLGYVSVILRQVEGYTRRIDRLEVVAETLRNEDLAPARMYQRVWTGLSALTLAFGLASSVAVYKQKLLPSWEQELSERIAAEQDCRKQVEKVDGVYSAETMAPCIALHRQYFRNAVEEKNSGRRMTYGTLALAFLSCSLWAARSGYHFHKECKETEDRIRHVEAQIESSMIDRDLWNKIMGVGIK